MKGAPNKIDKKFTEAVLAGKTADNNGKGIHGTCKGGKLDRQLKGICICIKRV